MVTLSLCSLLLASEAVAQAKCDPNPPTIPTVTLRFFGQCVGNVCLAGTPITFVAQYEPKAQDCLLRQWFNETFALIKDGYGEPADVLVRTFAPGTALTHVAVQHGSMNRSNIAAVVLQIVDRLPDPPPPRRRAASH